MKWFNAFKRKVKAPSEIELEKKIIKGERALSFNEYLRLGDKLREDGFPKKAYKIHRSLLASPSIKKEQEAKLKRSIGLDALKIGSFRAATNYLMDANKLFKGENRTVKEALLFSLEKIGEWEDAFELKKTLLLEEKTYTDENFSTYIACAGEELFHQDRKKTARDFFIKALKLNPHSPIALLYMGDLEKRKDKKVEYWQKALNSDPSLSMHIIERFKNFFFEKGEFEKIETFFEKQEEPIFRLGYADFLVKTGREAEAKRVLINLKVDQDTEILEESLFLALQIGDMELVKNFGTRLHNAMKYKKYRCGSCGYESKTLLFRCPECGELEKFNKTFK